MWKELKKLFCRHNTVRAVRWHPNVLLPGMSKNKILYEDRLRVLYFIRCACCDKFLDVAKGYERFFEERQNKN